MILNGTYWEFVPKSFAGRYGAEYRCGKPEKVSGRCHRKLKSGTAGRPAGCGPTETSDTALRTRNHPDRRLGLVSNILHDEIFADDAEWIRPNEETALWYYKSSLVCTGKETLVVSMPHPNRAAKCWTLELEKILRETGRL